MYSALNTMAGNQPFNDWFLPDTTQRHPLGMKVDAVDPYWGWGTFVYAKASGVVGKGLVCIVDATYLALGVPNAANQGFPLAVAMAQMAANTFGWFQVQGLAVYKTNATVAADVAIGITGVGILGTNAAGKQVLGCRNLRAATATVAITANTVNGSGFLTTGGYDGIFLGITLSGTGVPASTVAAGLDPDGRTIRMGSAIGTFDKTATATGTITLTGTYTGYGAGMVNAPFAQGAIT